MSICFHMSFDLDFNYTFEPHQMVILTSSAWSVVDFGSRKTMKLSFVASLLSTQQ